MSPLIDQLISALCCLPSVGPRSAQRMAMHLLENNREGGMHLSEALSKAMSKIKNCEQCRTFTEDERCSICLDLGRDEKLLCIVESPSDIIAIEQSNSFKGKYFVLMGHLSPIDGIGPEEIGIDILLKNVREGRIEEIIIATNPTVEGDATAFYISEASKDLGVSVSRIAHGVPVGGELEYVDSNTLSHAFSGRKSLD